MDNINKYDDSNFDETERSKKMDKKSKVYDYWKDKIAWVTEEGQPYPIMSEKDFFKIISQVKLEVEETRLIRDKMIERLRLLAKIDSQELKIIEKELSNIILKIMDNMKCLKCDSKEITMLMGSTNLKPINDNIWYICKICLYEWDTGEKWKK